jgi:hypothetical protein
MGSPLKVQPRLVVSQLINTVIADADVDGVPASQMVRKLTCNVWPIVLSALIFFSNSNIDSDLFHHVQKVFQSFTILCGALQINSVMNACLTGICLQITSGKGGKKFSSSAKMIKILLKTEGLAVSPYDALNVSEESSNY